MVVATKGDVVKASIALHLASAWAKQDAGQDVRIVDGGRAGLRLPQNSFRNHFGQGASLEEISGELLVFSGTEPFSVSCNGARLFRSGSVLMSFSRPGERPLPPKAMTVSGGMGSRDFGMPTARIPL